MNLVDWDLGNVSHGITWGGVDEAGRGAWAGPVVAACAVLDHRTIQKWRHVLEDVRDSKQLKPARREALAAELKTVLPAYAVAEVDNLGIDRENILEATFMAMRGAVSQASLTPKILFVDGNQAPRTGLPERLLVEGDATSCAVACASILAKTHRDEIMRRMDDHYEGYAFGQHKGYGTPRHRAALAALGPCAIHRISFAPVAAIQSPSEQLRDEVRQSLERCDSVMELHAWVEVHLRPAYGKLKLVWVETLRRRYAALLTRLVAGEEGLV
ncbi:MAG: ribonuclease HII [Acidobacteriota bacterium]|nr:ribonuclease HII [Acidobacteriota bacterium]